MGGQRGASSLEHAGLRRESGWRITTLAHQISCELWVLSGSFVLLLELTVPSEEDTGVSLNNLHATHARAGTCSRLFWRGFSSPLGIVEILHSFYPIALVLIARRRSTRAQEL